MVRWDKRPVHVVWRSADAPVWNHFVDRPLLLWEAGTGPSVLAIEALRDGADLTSLRLAPPTDTAMRQRLERDAEVSLAAVRRATDEFERNRWRRADHLRLADDLWAVTKGYLDVLDALSGRPAADRWQVVVAGASREPAISPAADDVCLMSDRPARSVVGGRRVSS